MRKCIGCLCLVLTLLLTACGDNTPPSKTGNSQSVSQSSATIIDSTATQTIATSTSTVPSASASTISTASTASTDSTATTTTSTTTTTSAQNSTPHTTTQITTSATTVTTTTPSTTPDGITFKVTIRESVNKQTVGGVCVTVYVDGSTTPAGSAITDSTGVALIPMQRGKSYRVELSDLPSGYEANAYYTFSTTMVNITIRKVAVQNEADHSQAQYEEGRKMTDFCLTDIDGNSYRLSDLLAQKQLIILDFWFTTCEPCKMEFPYFESAVQKYGDKISLLAVNPINDNQAMAALRQQLGVTFPMLKDTCNLFLGFGVTSYPTTVFIDANGVIVDIHQGAYTSEKDFFAAIERYLH